MTSTKELKKLPTEILIEKRDYYLNEIRKKISGLHMHSIGMIEKAFAIVNISLIDEGVTYRHMGIGSNMSRIEDNQKWIDRCVASIKRNNKELERVEKVLVTRQLAERHTSV